MTIAILMLLIVIITIHILITGRTDPRMPEGILGSQWDRPNIAWSPVKTPLKGTLKCCVC